MQKAVHSAIFHGRIRHRRFAPVAHEFEYRLFMLYLDLDELDFVFAGSRLFSAEGRAPAQFRRSDHLGDPAVPLGEAVRNLVGSQTGTRPNGPIRLLTHLRYFGYVFNPVSFYYCFDTDDHALEAIVAEVNNTPWRERHCYVLPASGAANDRAQDGGILKFEPEKAMHVSPFMPMEIDYDWRFSSPDDKLNVHMVNYRQGARLFDATLRLERTALSPAALRQALFACPFMTFRIITSIHWQALKLWLKKCPVYTHPAGQRDTRVPQGDGR